MFLYRTHTHPDALAVLEASALLAVSEFRIFEIAHLHWYGVKSDEATTERHFIPYMFREDVPHYVRAFTRKVADLDAAGELDPEEFGIRAAQRTVRGVTAGLFYSLGIVVTMTVLVTLAKVTAERLGIAECMFPPCF